MRPIAPADRLFLDFDGVLCDSLEECFRSSWLALEGRQVTATRPQEPGFDGAYRARFRAARPFVRSGEDYLVVHEWAAQGRVPSSQAEFDASLGEKGPAAMARLKERLYEVREALLEHHGDLWLSWNPLYAGVAEALAAQADNPAVLVLSTKKAEFITRILGYHGVAWPAERTVYTGPRKKLDLVAELAPGLTSILVDDQVDHLDFSRPDYRCYLARWGYVTPGTPVPEDQALNLTQALDLISSFPRTPRPTG